MEVDQNFHSLNIPEYWIFRTGAALRLGHEIYVDLEVEQYLLIDWVFLITYAQSLSKLMRTYYHGDMQVPNMCLQHAVRHHLCAMDKWAAVLVLINTQTF